MFVGPDDVGALGRGCTLLGSGGGGSVTAAEPLLRGLLGRHGPVRLVAAAELPPDARVACVGAVGSSAVMLERLPGGAEFAAAVRALEDHLRTPFDAVMTLEIGGVNGLLGAVAAARLGLPLVDGDAMGRSYPRLDHTVLAGRVPLGPLALADAGGDVVVLARVSGEAVERIVRALLPALGTWSAVCLYAGTARQYAEHAVRGSVRRALALGREPRGDHAPPGAAAAVLFEGIVLEVKSVQPSAATRWVISLRHAEDERRAMRLDFAHEYVAAFDDGVPVAAAPDVICVVDARTGEVVGVDGLLGRQRVRVVRLAAPPELAGRPELGLPAYGFVPAVAPAGDPAGAVPGGPDGAGA